MMCLLLASFSLPLCFKIPLHFSGFIHLVCLLITPHGKYFALLVAQMVKNLFSMRETPVWSLSQEDPLEKGMAATPVFLPGEFHRQRNLASYSPQGGKESDTTEWLSLHTSKGALDWEQDKLLDRHLLDIVVYWSDHKHSDLSFLICNMIKWKELNMPSNTSGSNNFVSYYAPTPSDQCVLFFHYSASPSSLIFLCLPFIIH